ncbi:MAG: hypothetical protein WC242_03725 [Candidatus Paceibacterota bacterium]|jgi:NH3-dependent NAD+ synthetase
MFKRPLEEVDERLIQEAKGLAVGRKRVSVAFSGGVDSTVVVTILCRAFGAENVLAFYRNIRSNPLHEAHVYELQELLGFNLMAVDANPIYDTIVGQAREWFQTHGYEWHNENQPGTEESGFTNAFASLKSRITTPYMGFLAKAWDGGKGIIFGTGNAEEDGLVRYFDKYGDGAVDNNILSGLTKMEVRQIALYYAKVYGKDGKEAQIFRAIAEKLPSADLKACGDVHNDESELTFWARTMGYDIQISYGDCEKEGNLAWALKQDLDHGVITGSKNHWGSTGLSSYLDYTDKQIKLIAFLRKIERSTRHKANPNMPGLSRVTLRMEGYVD